MQRLRVVGVAAAVLFGLAAALRAQAPHTKVLPQEIGFVLLGSYELDRPTSTGAKEIHVTIVDDKLRLRIGQNESPLIFEGTALEDSGGVTTDVYKFTVVGKPGVQMSFKVIRGRGRVDYLTLFEEFAQPEVLATGKPKRASRPGEPW